MKKVWKMELTDGKVDAIINSINSKGAVDDFVRGAYFIIRAELSKA